MFHPLLLSIFVDSQLTSAPPLSQTPLHPSLANHDTYSRLFPSFITLAATSLVSEIALQRTTFSLIHSLTRSLSVLSFLSSSVLTILSQLLPYHTSGSRIFPSELTYNSRRKIPLAKKNDNSLGFLDRKRIDDNYHKRVANEICQA